MREIMRQNAIADADIEEAIFSATPDLTAAFAATAARTRVGLKSVLFGTLEAAVDGSPHRCIRVLVHARSQLAAENVSHVYLRGAAYLRSSVPGTPKCAPSALECVRVCAWWCVRAACSHVLDFEGGGDNDY